MLQAHKITKKYGIHGIEDISFSVHHESVLAVVGPNGAGKSTLFNVLLNLTKPDSGFCTFNEQPLTELIPSRVGFLPEKHFLIQYFTVHEMLAYVNSMRSLKQSRSQIEDIINEFDLGEFRNIKCKHLSQGSGRRVAMALAFIGCPELLILDEPTNGLDIKSVINFKLSLLSRVKNGCTAIVSSHIPDFLTSVADRVLFINKRIVSDMPATNTMSLETKYRELFG
jgi:ABC-type multidrug transport system ATPase subunit